MQWYCYGRHPLCAFNCNRKSWTCAILRTYSLLGRHHILYAARYIVGFRDAQHYVSPPPSEDSYLVTQLSLASRQPVKLPSTQHSHGYRVPSLLFRPIRHSCSTCASCRTPGRHRDRRFVPLQRTGARIKDIPPALRRRRRLRTAAAVTDCITACRNPRITVRSPAL